MNYRAMISFGDKLVAMNINNYNRINDNNIKVYLTDDSILYMHPEDIHIYNADSEVMKAVEDTLFLIKIEDSSDKVDEVTVDKAIIQKDDNLFILDVVSASTASLSTVKLNLYDDTKLEVHPKHAKVYSSKSPIMKQIEDEIVVYQHQRIKTERKVRTKRL